MSTALLALGSLPNLHPAVVHFPVALILLGLVVELLRLLRPRVALDWAATALQPAAALSAWAAFLAGRAAAGGLGPLPPETESALAQHADLALWTAVVASATALLRLAVFPHPGRSEPERRSLVHALTLAGAVASSLLVGLTADHGGALVYTHAVAVARPAMSSALAVARSEEPAPAPEPAAPRITRDAEGVLSWAPRSTDAAALGRTISTRGSVTAAPASAGNEGLAVSAQGPGVVCLAEELGDGLLRATLDPSLFTGRFGLAYHAAAPGTAIVFTIAGGEEARLARLAGAAEAEWDRAAVTLKPGPIELAVSSAGHHHKGFVGGTLVAHGHGDSGEAGCAGVWLEGRGSLRILALSFAPVNGH